MHKTSIPKWLTYDENYVPCGERGTFIIKTINTLGTVMSRLRIQKGHEKRHSLPAILKLVALLIFLIMLSITGSRLLMLASAAVLNVYLATWSGRDILNILKSAFAGSLISLIILLPAMCMYPQGAYNNLIIVIKVFLSLEALNIFNHTTQWNHITASLRKLHIPGIFVFTLDITLKYIVLLGTLICDMLTALSLRSVGRNDKKQKTVGGIMGTTFIRSVEMSRQMYEAMQCRGFTDDYN